MIFIIIATKHNFICSKTNLHETCHPADNLTNAIYNIKWSLFQNTSILIRWFPIQYIAEDEH